LSLITDHNAIPKLLPLLLDKNEVIVEHAGRSIANSLKPNDNALINELLSHPNANMRLQMVHAIDRRLWNESYVPTLIKMLRTDPDWLVRNNVTEALGNHKVYSARPDLENALKDQSPQVQMGAREALRELGSTIRIKGP
jgi:HEAT repeat protein